MLPHLYTGWTQFSTWGLDSMPRTVVGNTVLDCTNQHDLFLWANWKLAKGSTVATCLGSALKKLGHYDTKFFKAARLAWRGGISYGDNYFHLWGGLSTKHKRGSASQNNTSPASWLITPRQKQCTIEADEPKKQCPCPMFPRPIFVKCALFSPRHLSEIDTKTNKSLQLFLTYTG